MKPMQERSTTELMSTLTINPSSETNQSESTSTSTAKISLTKLPFEIKQNIVQWLHELASEDEPFSDDGSDIEEVDDLEFSNNNNNNNNHHHTQHNIDPNLKFKSILKNSIFKSSSSIPPINPNPSISTDNNNHEQQTDKKKKPYTNPIHALSLVDRTFYALCRPFIWQNVDLEEFNLTKLRKFRTQVLVRQADYVRSLWWRSTESELQEYEPEGWKDEKEETEWDAELRSIELLGILESCNKITNLDIDLYCPDTHEFMDKDGNFIYQNSPTWRFVEPVSRLTHLTTISLTAAGDVPFQELFLVRLIRDMHHLETFACSLIFPDWPNFETSSSITTCRSPLALHLASLSSLKVIDLDQADCFDMSWSTIEWQGRLQNIILDDCSRATLPTIHQFCNKFSSTLIKLDLTNLPSDQEDTTKVTEEINSGKYRFELAKLRELSIANELPISFLRLFEDSKRIEQIELGISSEYNAQDLESIIKTNQGGGFPNLKKLVISLGDSDITMGEIEALELFYLSKGVALEFANDDDDDDDDDEDDDDEDSENDDDSVDYQLEVELEGGWEDDNGEEEEEEFDDEDFD